MKTTNTFGILFYLRRYKSKDGKAPIYVRITVDGKRTDVAIKTDIEIDKWNNLKGMAKGKSEEIRSLNTYLDKIRNRLIGMLSGTSDQKEIIMLFTTTMGANNSLLIPNFLEFKFAAFFVWEVLYKVQ
jgi:hypothetical protein